MDPYLEDPAFWRDFHSRFINACSEILSDRLPDSYEARIDEQLRLVEHTPERVVDRFPDVAVTVGTPNRSASKPNSAAVSVATLEPVSNRMPVEAQEIRESWIEIIHRPERSLVTVIEILSPTNKAGIGYWEYRDKRLGILQQRAHLVEIDLLLTGRRNEMQKPLQKGDYFAYVSRQERRPEVEVYAWFLRDELPTIPIPLKAPDPDIGLNIAEVFAVTYDRGRYGRSLPYGAAPQVSLPEEARAWARERGAAAKP
jgi:hypothetical protein